MDLMDVRREMMGVIASMVGGGIVFPSNVEVKTFTLDSDVTGSTNFTIPNPFGRTDMKRIIGVNFSDTYTNNLTVAFFVNPPLGISDNQYNRKIINNNNYMSQTNYYAIVSMTNDSITLRNGGNSNFAAGTYYMFAW